MATSLPALICVFIFIVPSGLASSEGLPEMLLKVHTYCGKTTSDETVLTVVSDVALNVVVECQGNKTFNVSRVELSEFYNRTVFMTGDYSEECLFVKKTNSEIYQVELEIAYKDDIESVLDTYLVSCIYEPYKAVESSVREISKSLFPPKQLETHLGHVAQSTFSMEVQDINGHTLTGVIGLRKKIRLVAIMSGTATEQGFKVVHCDALGDGAIKYTFLRSGCGDGFVIKTSQGFVTSGLTATSPYFWSFTLYDSDTISFQCTFNTCINQCDGDSCRRRKRRKRNGQSEMNKNKANEVEKEEITVSTNALQITAPVFLKEKQVAVSLPMQNKRPVAETIPHKISEEKQRTEALYSLTSTNKKTSDLVNPNNNNGGKFENVRNSKSYSQQDTNPGQPLPTGKLSSAQPVASVNSVKSKRKSGMSYDQIGALIGCISFLVMVGVFVCVTFWHLRQKNDIESKYKSFRVKNLGSTTYLLDDVEE